MTHTNLIQHRRADIYQESLALRFLVAKYGRVPVCGPIVWTRLPRRSAA